MRARGSSLRTGLVDATGVVLHRRRTGLGCYPCEYPVTLAQSSRIFGTTPCLGDTALRAQPGRRGIFEEDTISLAVELQNQSFIPQFLVTLVEHCPLAPPDERARGFLIAGIAPKKRMILSYETSCYRRGQYRFPPLEFESSAPFGLFSSRRRLSAPLEIKVYPAVLPVDAAFLHGSPIGQLQVSNLPQQGGQLRGSREFQAGDQARHIHWRSTARRGQTMVKEFDGAPQSEVLLAFNPGIDIGDGRESTLEYSVKIAASVARWCFTTGQTFSHVAIAS